MTGKTHPPSDSPDQEKFYLTHKHSVPHPGIKIGMHTCGIPHISAHLQFSHLLNIEIGDYCSFGSNVNIDIPIQHEMAWATTYPFLSHPTKWKNAKNLDKNQLSCRARLIIGNNVWIGKNATIYGGTDIGDGAIIGANTVVTGVVRPYSVVVGNPGKEIKRLFDDQTIEALLHIKWWEWSEEKINENLHLICDDPTELIKKFG